MKAIIGLEIHVHVLTKSKLFCGCSTDYEDKEPNSVTCPICLGFPGAKPKLNRKVLDSAILVAKALGCEINSPMFFSRKSYLYPDLAKNFQITQYEIPLAVRGTMLLVNKKIRIRRVHIEEDPAKLIHVGGDITSSKYVLVDYNRSGIPLLEIVTEPDFESVEEVGAFLSKISSILEYLDVFNPSMEGSLRIDANISLEGGERAEIKNITGFKNVEKALNFEIVRQNSMSKMDLKVERETRHFNAENNSTVTLRKKEFEEDYGYIFEPDLTKIEIPNKTVDDLVSKMPELPDHRVERFLRQYSIPYDQSRVLVYVGKDLAEFFEECCKLNKDAKTISKWIVTDLLKCLNFQGTRISKSNVEPRTFIELLELIESGSVTERLAKEIIKEYVATGVSPKTIVKNKGLTLIGEEELIKTIKDVIKENNKAVCDYKNGKEEALKYLLGQVLRKIEARADPNKIKTLIESMI